MLFIFNSLCISLSISFLEEFERNYRHAIIGTISFSRLIRYRDSATHIFDVVRDVGDTSLEHLFLSLMTASWETVVLINDHCDSYFSYVENFTSI